MIKKGIHTQTRIAAWMFALAAPSVLGQETPPEPRPEPSDLGERLIRKAVTAADEDLMEAIMRLMGQAAEKLDVEFDPGPDTQHLQEQVVTKLDEAISAAAAQTRAQKKSSKSSKSDKRNSPPSERGARKKESKSPGETADAQDGDSADARAHAATTEQAGGTLEESRRAWGQLPMRDRDEVLQGAGEEYLERYRVWIQQYFRALQEGEEESP